MGLVGIGNNSYQIKRIIKTIRLFGIALLTVLMSVSFSACSSSDDDDNNGSGGSSSASIEGTWYLKAEKWFTDAYRPAVPLVA